jgi:uncharacterized membrane protein HdeD (DUF308 family)
MTQTFSPTSAPRAAHRRPRSWPATLGGAAIALAGVASISFPLWSGAATVSLIAWTLVLVGLLRMLTAFHRAGGWRWKLLGGLAALAAGGVLLWRPAIGAVGITLLIAAVLLADGLFALEEAIRRRREGRLQDLMFWRLALVDGLLAILVMAAWPFRAQTALGVLVGLSLILSGLTLITGGRGRDHGAAASSPVD